MGYGTAPNCSHFTGKKKGIKTAKRRVVRKSRHLTKINTKSLAISTFDTAAISKERSRG